MGDKHKTPPWMGSNPQAKQVPVTFRQRGGKPVEARVAWESSQIDGRSGLREAERSVASARPAAAPVGAFPEREKTDGNDARESTGGILGSGIVSGEIRVGNHTHSRLRAQDVFASASWTGRRSLQDQVQVIMAFGPMASDSVQQLASAIEQRRLNDPATATSLEALRELHSALGELISAAVEAQPLEALWRRVELTKEKLTGAVWDGAQVMLVAPALAMGTATILSFLSGFPVSEGMVTALCATGMTKEALVTLAKRR